MGVRDPTFETWVEANQPALLRFAAAYVRPGEREDLVQDTLTRAWLKRDTFDATRGQPRGWLMAIMAGLMRDRWRRPRGPHLSIPPSDVADPQRSDAARIDIRRAVNALPRRQREVIILHYYVDLSVLDIAGLLGCSSGTVKSSLHDARKHLSHDLKAEYHDRS